MTKKQKFLNRFRRMVKIAVVENINEWERMELGPLVSEIVSEELGGACTDVTESCTLPDSESCECNIGSAFEDHCGWRCPAGEDRYDIGSGSGMYRRRLTDYNYESVVKGGLKARLSPMEPEGPVNPRCTWNCFGDSDTSEEFCCDAGWGKEEAGCCTTECRDYVNENPRAGAGINKPSAPASVGTAARPPGTSSS